jgi:hypothetical protein
MDPVDGFAQLYFSAVGRREMSRSLLNYVGPTLPE